MGLTDRPRDRGGDRERDRRKSKRDEKKHMAIPWESNAE
jgi:hypothetical protein